MALRVRLPGIEASAWRRSLQPAEPHHPRSEFRLRSPTIALPPRSEFRLRSPTEVGIPTSLSHRGRNSDFALPPRSEFRLREPAAAAAHAAAGDTRGRLPHARRGYRRGRAACPDLPATGEPASSRTLLLQLTCCVAAESP